MSEKTLYRGKVSRWYMEGLSTAVSIPSALKLCMQTREMFVL